MKEYNTVMIKISDIKLDGENPNVMNKDMEKRLDGSLETFGNTQDIIIDANTMILADGEHRLKRYIAKGYAIIPAKLVPFESDSHRRAYRQAANKIHGLHDPILDSKEYLKIMEANNQELLKIVTGMNLTQVQTHLRNIEAQSKLGLDGNNPYEEWRKSGGLDFENSDKRGYRTILIHFVDKQAVDDFIKLTGQELPEKARYIWFPKQENYKRDEVFVDAE